MRKSVRNNLLLIALFIAAAFILGITFADPIEFKRYMDGARIGVWTVLFLVVVKTAWDTFWDNAKTGGEIAAVNLAFLAFVILLQALYVPLKRERPDLFSPDFIADMASFLALGYTIAGMGFLAPIGNVVGKQSPRSYWFLTLAIGIGCLVVGISLGLGVKPILD